MAKTVNKCQTCEQEIIDDVDYCEVCYDEYIKNTDQDLSYEQIMDLTLDLD